MLGCGGNNGNSDTGTTDRYAPVKEAGFYSDLRVAPNGEFLVRGKIKNENIAKSGLVYKVEMNNQNQISKITSLDGGKPINTKWEDILHKAYWTDFAVVNIEYQDDYVKYAMITAFSLCGANVLNVFYRRRFCDIKFVLHMNWRKHFPGIIMLFVMLFAQQIYCNSDITMLGIMRSNYEVGLNSLSVRI